MEAVTSGGSFRSWMNSLVQARKFSRNTTNVDFKFNVKTFSIPTVLHCLHRLGKSNCEWKMRGSVN